MQGPQRTRLSRPRSRTAHQRPSKRRVRHPALGPRRDGSIGLTASLALWLDVAMKRVKIAELKDQLSCHLREVERGGEVEVTDRDRPIARIVPVGSRRRRCR